MISKRVKKHLIHRPCSVPNKLVHHGFFPPEHARAAARLLGTPEYALREQGTQFNYPSHCTHCPTFV